MNVLSDYTIRVAYVLSGRWRRLFQSDFGYSNLSLQHLSYKNGLYVNKIAKYKNGCLQ